MEYVFVLIGAMCAGALTGIGMSLKTIIEELNDIKKELQKKMK